MKDEKQLGTSLEVLAPYLPYGIEIQVKTGWGGSLDVMTGTLAGLNPREKEPVRLEMFNQGGIKTFFSDWELAGCLPCLLPFRALTEQLPDGTVPAEVVLKMMGYEHYFRGYIKRLFVHGMRLMMEVDGAAFEKESYEKPGPMTSHIWGENAKPAIVDYLRSKHFALPVNGRPLVEGVDFIAKSSAAVPTIEKTEAAAD